MRVLSESNNKSRDTPLAKRVLEVVSEVNEENIKETQATQSASSCEEEVEENGAKTLEARQGSQGKKSDFILEELFFVQSKIESPK